MFAHSAMVILFGIVAILTWHDRPADEREQSHKLISAQAAFTAAGAALLCSIVYGGLIEGHVEPEIYWVFAAMLIGKVAGRIWAEYYR